MSWRRRDNENSNVRGPNSALTEFLREKGINAAEIQRRAYERAQAAQRDEAAGEVAGLAEEAAAAAGPSTPSAASPPAARPGRASRTRNAPILPPATPEEEPIKGKKKKPAKKRKRKGDGDGDDSADDDFVNPYKKAPKLPGQVEFCEECDCRFTVTAYSKAAPNGGLLCTACGKKSADDKPQKKKTVVRKREKKLAANKLLDGEGRGAKSLSDMCIEMVAQNIEDVESFYGLGEKIMDKICQIVCRKRRLTSDIFALFFDPGLTELNLYDCSKLHDNDFMLMAENLPELTRLSLNYAGAMTDESLNAIVANMKQLKSFTLDGAYLITKEAWIKLFTTFGSQFEKLCVGSSVRVDKDVMNAIARNCPKLKHLHLKYLPSIGDEALSLLSALTELESLEIELPEEADIHDGPIVEILNATGSTLRTLAITGGVELTAETTTAIKASCHNLLSLDLTDSESIPAAAVVDLFNGWESNNSLIKLSVSRIYDLDDEGFRAILDHSGPTLEELNLNGCKMITKAGWETVIERGLPKLQLLDVGFVRSVDDGVLEGVAAKSPDLAEVRVWGVPMITQMIALDKSIRIIGREADILAA